MEETLGDYDWLHQRVAARKRRDGARMSIGYPGAFMGHLPSFLVHLSMSLFSVSHPPLHLLAKQRLILCRLDKVSSRHDQQWTSRGVQRPQKISAGEHDQFHQEAMKRLVRVCMKPETMSFVFVSNEVVVPSTAA